MVFNKVLFACQQEMLCLHSLKQRTSTKAIVVLENLFRIAIGAPLLGYQFLYQVFSALYEVKSLSTRIYTTNNCMKFFFVMFLI